VPGWAAAQTIDLRAVTIRVAALWTCNRNSCERAKLGP
jgi:hypothetical protein